MGDKRAFSAYTMPSVNIQEFLPIQLNKQARDFLTFNISQRHLFKKSKASVNHWTLMALAKSQMPEF